RRGASSGTAREGSPSGGLPNGSSASRVGGKPESGEAATRTALSAGSPTTTAEPRESTRGAAASASTAANAPAPPSAGDNSLYRIGTDGTVRELFREKTLVLCHLRQNGRIFVGTGMDGQLFEVDEASRERSEIARLDHGQILCMLRRRDGSIVLGTGDPGKL